MTVFLPFRVVDERGQLVTARVLELLLNIYERLEFKVLQVLVRMPKAESNSGKAQRKKINREEAIQLLKIHLAITPKTANMLYDSGYTAPSSLRSATPNQVAAKFAVLPGMDAKKAKDYVRPLRRMVMLGDMEDTEEAASAAKSCQKWSIKHLESLGVWQEGFDELTGSKIHETLKGIYPAS